MFRCVLWCLLMYLSLRHHSLLVSPTDCRFQASYEASLPVRDVVPACIHYETGSLALISLPSRSEQLSGNGI